MTDLLSSLISANNVIVNAYTKWEEGARLRAQAASFQKTRKQDLMTRTIVLTGGIFATCFMGLLVIVGIPAWLFQSEPMVIGGFLFTLPVSLVVTVFGYARFVHPKTKKDEAKIKDDYNAAMERAAQITQAGTDVIQENVSEIIFLPDEYCYPLATGYLVKCVQQQRANSLQEALDKFDEQLHRWTLEANQQEMLRQQQLQSQQLNAIRHSIDFNTAVTAAGFATDILSRL